MEKLVHRTGYVTWPRHLPDSGEGGMFVYAFWTAQYTQQRMTEVGIVDLLTGGDTAQTVEADPFLACLGPDEVIALPLPGGKLGPTCHEVYPPRPAGLRYVTPTDPDTRMRERYLAWERDCGAPVLAAICLGTTNACYTDGGAVWAAGRGDLTRPGRKLLARLDRLYGRRAHLVTYVDA